METLVEKIAAYDPAVQLRYDAVNAWMAEQRRNPSGRNLGGRKVGWKLMVVGKCFERIINNVPASFRIVV